MKFWYLFFAILKKHHERCFQHQTCGYFSSLGCSCKKNIVKCRHVDGMGTQIPQMLHGVGIFTYVYLLNYTGVEANNGKVRCLTFFFFHSASIEFPSFQQILV